MWIILVYIGQLIYQLTDSKQKCFYCLLFKIFESWLSSICSSPPWHQSSSSLVFGKVSRFSWFGRRFQGVDVVGIQSGSVGIGSRERPFFPVEAVFGICNGKKRKSRESNMWSHGYTKCKKYRRKLPLKFDHTWWNTISKM